MYCGIHPLFIFTERMHLHFLGTGTSMGVPVIGCDCPICTSSDPRHHRLRTSALVRSHGLHILIDVGPDFRMQALRANLRRIDAVLLTHAHFDHVAGIDDLRPFCMRQERCQSTGVHKRWLMYGNALRMPSMTLPKAPRARRLPFIRLRGLFRSGL